MAKRRGRRPVRVIKKNPHLINREIKAHEVKLVIEGQEPEVMSFDDAYKVAEGKNMDLVLMGAKANPPVVKIMDYSKYLYELNKKKPQNKPKPMKEVRFGPNTDDNDLEFKTKHIINFIEKGHKVKVFVFFRGREMAFRERGEKLLLNLAVALEDHCVVESMPKMEGRKMNMFLKPKAKKK
jgi:translation initiation factor IF-3